jgi:hypothetical protein
VQDGPNSAAAYKVWHDRPLTHMTWINWITINRPLTLPPVRLYGALLGRPRHLAMLAEGYGAVGQPDVGLRQLDGDALHGRDAGALV